MFAIVNYPIQFYEASLYGKHSIFIFELFLGYHEHHPCDIDIPIEQIHDESYTYSNGIARQTFWHETIISCKGKNQKSEHDCHSVRYKELQTRRMDANGFIYQSHIIFPCYGVAFFPHSR